MSFSEATLLVCSLSASAMQMGLSDPLYQFKSCVSECRGLLQRGVTVHGNIAFFSENTVFPRNSQSVLRQIAMSHRLYCFRIAVKGPVSG